MSPIAATRTTSACGSTTSRSAAGRRGAARRVRHLWRGGRERVWPFGVAVDKNGDVYVTDEWTNTVSVFDAKGKFIRKWGEPGSGPGELRGPAGIVCETNGNVIVVDSGNNRLQVFTPEGKLVAQCGKAGSGDGEFNKPWGIALDKDGNIYVADWKNHRVQKLSPSGKFMMSIGRYGKLPSRRLVRRDLPRPVHLQRAGVGAAQAGILNHPTGVAVDPDGDIYVTDWGNHRLSIFDKDGSH